MSSIVIVSQLAPNGGDIIRGIFPNWSLALQSLKETYSALEGVNVERESESRLDGMAVRGYSVRGMNKGTGGSFGPFLDRYRIEERQILTEVTHF